jgi:hypothetical protein
MTTNAFADFNGIQRRLETELHSWWLGWPDLSAATTIAAGDVYRTPIVDPATLSQGFGLFRALIDGPTEVPTADASVAGWEFLTWEMPILYENTMGIDAALAKLHQAGAVRLSVSWGSSRNRSLSGRYGRVREVEGTLTTWVHIPANQGTVKALKAAQWLREFLLNRDKGWINSCGNDVSLSNPDGPRSAQSPGGSEFYTHIITASLVTLETVGAF